MTRLDNKVYYIKKRSLKEHEKFMLNLIYKKNKNKTNLQVLDLGCADGLFLDHLNKLINIKSLTGIDNDKKLIKKANKIKFTCKNTFLCKNFENIKNLNQKFDIIIASGFFGLFEDPEKVIKKVIKLLKQDGNIYIFQRLNSFPIDTKYYTKLPNNKKWANPRTLYYYKNFVNLISKNKPIKIKKWNINFDLPKQNNPFASYTIKTIKKERIMLNLSNIVIEQYFVWSES
tara:strand:+ start:736 stop:1425 length:690 start_codon:yes stop_codon:yes gene_type:complete